jgi:alcohol dehydrogenase
VIKPFGFNLPVRIAFGAGSVGNLTAVLDELGATNALVVTEAPVATIAAVEEAIAICPGVYLKPGGEPTFEMIAGLTEALRARDADAIVAIGGGSTMDLAKAARLEFGQGEPFERFTQFEVDVTEPSVPLVTVPTTSGTGSEVSGGAVVTVGTRKRGAAHPLMRAQHALVDPLLTLDLPPAPTRDCGIDALAQAIGGVIVRNRNPGSIALGLEACRYLAQGFPAAVADGHDQDARTQTSLGSLMAGLSMNLSDCGADHGLGHALGGIAHLPHGLTVGLFLAEALDTNRRVCAPLLERVADALGEPAGEARDGSRAVSAVRRILGTVEFPTCGSLGLDPGLIEAMVPAALDDYCLSMDPLDWSEADIRGAYDAAWALSGR